jgi:hypothetical protein
MGCTVNVVVVVVMRSSLTGDRWVRWRVPDAAIAADPRYGDAGTAYPLT